MRRILSSIVALSLASAVPTFADTLTRSDRRVLRKAAQVLEISTSAPDKGIPKELLERAECVLVFPGVKKGAFIVGGKYGRGVATCRQENGRMGPPSFYSTGGGSIGFQWGGNEADLILLVMNEDGVDYLLQDKFTLGGEASAAIGPVGRTAHAATDAQLRAQILSWSRSRGLFAGASLEGAVVKPSREANERLYGRSVTGKEILVASRLKVPSAAKDFTETASRLSARGGVETASERMAPR